MVALRRVKIPYYRGIGRQRGRNFRASAQVFGRTAIPFLHKYIVPAAKRLFADLSDFAVTEIGEVVSGRKKIRTATKSVRRQSVRKLLGSGSRQRTASQIIPAKPAKQTSRSQ